MNLSLRLGLGLETFSTPEILPPVTEAEMIQSTHELNEAFNEVSTTEQDIKAVQGYTDIIERIDPSDVNNVVATEAIYIGLEHLLNKHSIHVNEMFPSLESWEYKPVSNKTVTLENVYSLTKSLKQKGKAALDWLIKKFLEWKEKIKNFFRRVFKKKVQEEIKAHETAVVKVEKDLAKATPEQKKVVEEKLEKQPMVKEAKVDKSADLIIELDSKQAYVIKMGINQIKSEYSVIGGMMEMSNLIDTLERPNSFGEKIASSISKSAVLNNFDKMVNSNTVLTKQDNVYTFNTLNRHPYLDVSDEQRATSGTKDNNFEGIIKDADKSFKLDKSAHDRLNNELKELLEIYEGYVDDDKMLKELQRGSKRLSEVKDGTTAVVKFTLDCSYQHMESARLAIETRRAIIKNFPISIDDLVKELEADLGVNK